VNIHGGERAPEVHWDTFSSVVADALGRCFVVDNELPDVGARYHIHAAATGRSIALRLIVV